MPKTHNHSTYPLVGEVVFVMEEHGNREYRSKGKVKELLTNEMEGWVGFTDGRLLTMSELIGTSVTHKGERINIA